MKAFAFSVLEDESVLSNSLIYSEKFSFFHMYRAKKWSSCNLKCVKFLRERIEM